MIDECPPRIDASLLPEKAQKGGCLTKEDLLLAEAKKHCLLHAELEANCTSVDLLLMVVQRLETEFHGTLRQLIRHALECKAHEDHIATLYLLDKYWTTQQKGWQQVTDRLVQWRAVRFSYAGRRDADIFDRLYDVFGSAERQVLQRFCDQLDGLCFASKYVLPKLETTTQGKGTEAGIS